jgi:toxin YoeB
MFEIEFTQQALADIDKHKKAGNKALLNKLESILGELYQHPFTGTGKPEPLKHNLTGYWSRRINKEHRLVYQVTDNIVYISSLYGHY